MLFFNELSTIKNIAFAIGSQTACSYVSRLISGSHSYLRADGFSCGYPKVVSEEDFMNRGHSIYGYDKFIRLDELETPQLKSLIFAIHRVVKDRDGFILQINKLKMTEYKSNSWAEDTLEQELTHPISIFFSHNLTQAMFIKKDFQSVEDSSQDSVNVCFVGYADSYPEPILKKLGFRFDVYNKQVSEFIINSDYDVLEGSLAGFFSEDSPFVELEIINDYGRVEKIRIDIFSIECANGGKNITIIEGFSDYGPTRIILEKGAILSVQYNKE